MASAFWTLEDGRGFARNWELMAYILKLITDELKEMEDAKLFYDFLNQFVYRKENGDEDNGIGGFIRENKSIMFNFDLRTFAPKNRAYFWLATQNALTKIKNQDVGQSEEIDLLLTTLLDMHKRIKKGEDPMLLNHMRSLEPKSNLKLGPGW